MRIRNLAIWRLNLAFQYPFKHSLATHGGSENLVVGLTTDQGVKGFGEGIPRAFVTGETMTGSLDALTTELALRALAHPLPPPPDLLPTLDRLFPPSVREAAPAACCALETALLDAASRTLGLPLSHLFGPPARQSLTYSAVLPLASQNQMARFLKIVKAKNLRFIKVKVGGADDLAMLACIRKELGEEVDLRVDANGAWTAAEAVARLAEMAPFHLSAVEQPVPREDLAGLAQVSAASPIPVVADESLVTATDARRLIEARACKIFNLRLSKVGGFLPALRLRRMAEAAGLRCQLGCHVGETSILAAAGRHFAFTCPDLVYAEGSFAPYLLTRDPVDEPVVFHQHGEGRPLAGPGLGVVALESALNDLASYQTVVT
jgi:muconate cycloisomerase